MLITQQKYASLAIFLLFSIILSAQQDTAKPEYFSTVEKNKADSNAKPQVKLFVSVNGGASIPFGGYSIISFITYGNSSGNQFAGPGTNFNLLLGLPIDQKWESQLSLSYIVNSINDEDYADGYLYPFYNGSLPYNVADQNTKFDLYNALLALSRTFRSSKFSFDIKLLLGYTYGQFPRIQDEVTTTYGANKTAMATYTAPDYSAFAYGLGVGSKIFLSSKIYLMLNADMLITNRSLSTIHVQFDKPIVLSSVGTTVTETTIGNISPVEQLNLSLGIGYAFLKTKK